MKRYLLISAFLLFGLSCFGLGIMLGGWIGPIKSHKSGVIVECHKDYPKTYQIAGAGDDGFRGVYESPSLNPSPQGREIIEETPSISSPLVGEGRERGN